MLAPEFPSSDWRDAESYAHLREADRRMFAWEWLRRSDAYRRAWDRYGNAPDSPVAARVARWFALVALENPRLDARTARPIWHSDRDPGVVIGGAERPIAARTDLFDILRLAPLATVALGSDGSEHWLFSNGCWLLRLDIVAGTLLGGPTLLRYRLQGLTSALPGLQSLGALVRVAAAGSPVRPPHRPARRAERWVAELRTADALRDRASHRQIGRELFGELANTGWRLDSDAYRLRVQRLARSARANLRRPLAAEWFGF